MIEASEIKQLIENGIPDAEVTVLGDDGQHFEAIVKSARFIDQSRLTQHKMVYATLGNRFEGELHALAIKTVIPE